MVRKKAQAAKSEKRMEHVRLVPRTADSEEEELGILDQVTKQVR